MESRSWDRPARDDVLDEADSTEPARGSAAVERPASARREARSTTYGARQQPAAETDYPARRGGWDGPDSELDPDDRDDGEPDDGRTDRRGRFIEAAGWGRTADTTEWKLAATDDRLYRSPEGTRRDRAGDQGRRAKPADGVRRIRAETQGRSRSATDADVERREPEDGPLGGVDRPTRNVAGRERPTSGIIGRERQTGRAAGSERPTSSPAGAERPASGPAGWERPTSSAPGWGRSTDTGSTDTGQLDRTDTGQWDRSTDTGQWDRFTDTGPIDRITDTGQWARFTDTTEWSHGLLPRDGVDDRPWHDGGETFWSGTRLAGDDPRWMDTPESAPRSPAAAYSGPSRSNPAGPPRAGRVATAAPTRATGRPTYPSRSGIDPSASSLRWTAQRIEDDLLDADPGSPLAAVLYAAAWYAVPVLVFFVWLLTLDGNPPIGCVTDVTGGGCESARAKATTSLLGAAPRFGLAMMVSLVTAVLLRWASPTWKSGSVGLAAAVIGGGMSTVLVSVISGQALG